MVVLLEILTIERWRYARIEAIREKRLSFIS